MAQGQRRRAPLAAAGVALLGFLVASAAAAVLGAVATLPQIAGWYASLAKPGWTPPNAVFGPVWTVLYSVIAIAGWLVWRHWSSRPEVARRRRGALTAYWVQLVLNAAWSPLFFGAHLLRPAAADILALLVASLVTLVLFSRVSKPAALLFLPYVAWVAYAASLSVAVAALN